MVTNQKVEMRKLFLYIVFSFVILFSFCCGCKESIDDIPEEKPEIITDTTINKTKLFWLYYSSDAIPDALINSEAPRRHMVVLNAWFYPYISKFRAANPNIKVLVYKDLSSARSYAVEDGVDHEYLPSGVGYVYAMQNHPEWFLTDDDGNHLEYSGYSEHWQMDVGNSEYQEYWSDQVVNELQDKDWDGVLMDNALFTADTYHAGVFPKNYKTNQSFQDAYKSMLAVIKTKLDLKHKKGIANMANARLYSGLWDSYLEHMHGGFDEWWLVFGKNNYLQDYSEGMSVQIGEVSSAESQGKIALVQPHSGVNDEQGFYYAFASYWLVNEGNAYFSEQEVTDAYKNPSPWRKEYEWNFGKAAGSYYELGTRVYRRDFTRAIVIVNANSTGSVKIDLNKTCLDKDGQKVKSLILNAQSGVVLRKIVVEQ